MSDNADNIEIIRDFVQESRDALESLEQAVIALGRSHGDKQSLNVIFRLFHSMKGTAGFLGFKNIAGVTHAAESLLDLIRSGEMELRYPDHINLFIQAADFAKEALSELETNLDDAGLAAKASFLTSILQNEISKKSGTRPVEEIEPEPAAPTAPSPAHVEAKTQEITAKASEATKRNAEFMLGSDMVDRFIQESDELLQKFEQDLLEWMKTPGETALVSEAFRSIHSFKGNSGFFGFEDLEKLSHHMESLLDIVRTGGTVDHASATEALLSLKDSLRLSVADISRGGPGRISNIDESLQLLKNISQGARVKSVGTGGGGRLGEILLSEGLVTKEDVARALETQTKPLGEILVDMGAASPEAVQKALGRQVKDKPGADAAESRIKQGIVKRQDIRVDLEKLDSLITLIGELVIAENMMVNNPDLAGLSLENFNKAAQQTSKIVRELQELAMVVRMVPVAGLFRRMIRLVHDLSLKCGKKADLVLSGEETEVDKTIIEILTDPLVHMIRNSVDHGIEMPSERTMAGKPETGTVRLSASHEEGEVWIIVEDDGRGLSLDKIIAKARKQGLIAEDAELTEKEAYNLIFLPGFSTAEQVSDVSGRGVGMDVVRQNLDKINCKIDVFSKPGVGTKFTMRIPLTLAIIDGMLIRVGQSRYILPIISIRESFCPKKGAVTVSADGQELVRVREEFIPVVRLHELHKIKPDSEDLNDGILIVLDTVDGNLALFVDEILGQQQTVIKGLSKYISDVGRVRGVSGCTILGNGEVCLILDVGGLVEITQNRAGSWAGAGDKG